MPDRGAEGEESLAGARLVAVQVELVLRRRGGRLDRLAQPAREDTAAVLVAAGREGA
ncbi:hypothetical protein [Marinitenerispora sediminis]|uniref:hypothetical protein n=1 Tax=Marinitenerispora sediminis TaxID=1931232 RepID=UPI001314B909|nr:hypothetical protein [Marinitenerispora sediminis]